MGGYLIEDAIAPVSNIAIRAPRISYLEEPILQSRSYLRLGITLLVGLMLGWTVVATTMDRVFARKVPSLALWWNPDSADANAYYAESLLRTADLRHVMTRVASHANRSIRRQPVNAAAARLLGLAADAGRDNHRAERLMAYAEAMSRRDLPTQLWLIEANIAHDDVPTVLRHYDRAMRTSVSGRTVLFPILIAAAANDRKVWEPLISVLAQRPQWWRPFLAQLIPVSVSPEALYMTARRMGLDTGPGADTALTQATERRLVDLRAPDMAADLYNRAHRLPPATGAPLRNGNFDLPGGWDPFEWNLVDEPDLAAVRQPSPIAGDGNALFLSAGNSRSGDVAVQVIMLPQGSYAARATIGGVSGDPIARPKLIVRCAGDSRELLNAPFALAPETGSAWHGTFTIPAGCEAQRVVIQATSSLDPSDTAPWIDNIAIQSQGRH